MASIESIVLLILLSLNVCTFIVFGVDKYMAKSGTWRVSENTLWLLALIGGSVGAISGMYFFRHKTQKASFQLVMFAIVLIHVGIAYAFSYFSAR